MTRMDLILMVATGIALAASALLGTLAVFAATRGRR